MTTETIPWDPAKLRQAGVEPRHIARVLKVHPVTASNWLCGNTQPHKLKGAQIAALMTAVDNALRDTALPIDADGMPPDEWSVRTVATLKKYYRAAGGESTS